MTAYEPDLPSRKALISFVLNIFKSHQGAPCVPVSANFIKSNVIYKSFYGKIKEIKPIFTLK